MANLLLFAVTMADAAQPEGERLAAQIRRHIIADHPFAYCDGCLAQRFDVSLDEARLAALTVARADGFMRKTRACYGCGRTLEVTSTVS